MDRLSVACREKSQAAAAALHRSTRAEKLLKESEDRASSLEESASSLAASLAMVQARLSEEVALREAAEKAAAERVLVIAGLETDLATSRHEVSAVGGPSG